MARVGLARVGQASGMAAGLDWRLVGSRLVRWLVGTQLEHVVGSELGLGRGLGLGRLGPVDQLRLDDGAGDGCVGHVGQCDGHRAGADAARAGTGFAAPQALLSYDGPVLP